MFDPKPFVRAVADAATAWRDPDHPERAEAVEKTLAVENTFTEEAAAFAVNQQMALLSREALDHWVRGRAATRSRTVGVLNPGNIPLVGLQDFLAVGLVGHRYRGTLSSRSPYLLPAFVEEVRERFAGLDASFVPIRDVFEAAEALVATGSDETMQWVQAQCEKAGLPSHRVLLRGQSFGVAVLDGRESDDDYECLAEDVLLHEGMGCRSVAVIWAPAQFAPDAALDAFARFRGVFPAHEQTPGRLKMQQAFLEAVDAPHAFGEGLEFLVSRGEPEEQQPGHIRWSEYQELEEVDAWLRSRAGDVQLVVASDRVRRQLGASRLVLPLGEAQRPPLGWCPDGRDTIDFLVGLEE